LSTQSDQNQTNNQANTIKTLTSGPIDIVDPNELQKTKEALAQTISMLDSIRTVLSSVVYAANTGLVSENTHVTGMESAIEATIEIIDETLAFEHDHDAIMEAAKELIGIGSRHDSLIERL
jgi:hypothetical protein